MANRHERRAQQARRKLPLAKTRACGACTACCTSLGVPELPKAAGDPCPHSGAHGCSIYDSRPASCRAYRCLWLQGLFRAEHRPDLLGLIAHTSVKDGPLGPAGGVLVLREIVAGAWDKARPFWATLPDVPTYVQLMDGSRLVRSPHAEP